MDKGSFLHQVLLSIFTNDPGKRKKKVKKYLSNIETNLFIKFDDDIK